MFYLAWFGEDQLLATSPRMLIANGSGNTRHRSRSVYDPTEVKNATVKIAVDERVSTSSKHPLV